MVRWKDGRRSTNVDDRRGRSGGAGIKIGGGAALIVVVVSLLLGIDPTAILEGTGGGSPSAGGAPAAPPNPEQEELAEFSRAILASTEDVWGSVFVQGGGDYREPTLVLFDDAVRSACGMAGSATGPFYCPGDEQVYIDLTFFRQLDQLGAPGDFAEAYVIAHEVGHHVQTVLGTEQRVRQLQRQMTEAEGNEMSVRMELQADCYAGLWAHHANRQGDYLEPGDVEEGLRAAAAIGDDRLQERAGEQVQPETFTHGTSAQRVQWFRRGLQQGTLEACDTFGAGR